MAMDRCHEVAAPEACSLPLGVLASLSGTVYFYTERAFILWLESERTLSLQTMGTNSSTYDVADTNPVSITVSPDEKRLDGYTIDEWASFAKRKSSIASHVCKQNGLLKAKMSSLLNARGAKAPFVSGSLTVIYRFPRRLL